MKSIIKALTVILWIMPIIGVGFGMLILVSGLPTATGAPQEAVVAALACAAAILPYVFARAGAEILALISSSLPDAKAEGKPKYNYSTLPKD